MVSGFSSPDITAGGMPAGPVGGVAAGSGAAHASAARRSAGGLSPPSTRSGMSVVGFADDPTRLLCDPHNSLWLYGVFDFKFGVPTEETERLMRQLLQRMLRAAHYHYNASVKLLQQLPPNIQGLQVLRAIQTSSMMNAVILPPTSTTATGSPLLDDAAAASVTSSSPLAAAGRAAHRRRNAPPEAAPHTNSSVTAGDQSTGALGADGEDSGDGSPTHTRPPPTGLAETPMVRLLSDQWPPLAPRTEEEELSYQAAAVLVEQQQQQLQMERDFSAARASSLLGSGGLDTSASMLPSSPLLDHQQPRGTGAGQQQQQQLPPLPIIRVVIDIIASRKTLGAEPTHSPPYSLGQWVYDYLTRHGQGEGDGVSVSLGGGASSSSSKRGHLAHPRSGDPSAAPPVRVAQVFVGLSDSPVRMVGRDILFPFKIAVSCPTTTPLSRVLTASQQLAMQLNGKNSNANAGASAGGNGAAAAAGGTDAGMGNATLPPLLRPRSASGVSASALTHNSSFSADERNLAGGRGGFGLRHSALSSSSAVSSTVGSFTFAPLTSGLVPVCLRQPPLHIEQVDQRRFIICSPKCDGRKRSSGV